jgi:hypothetical protein
MQFVLIDDSTFLNESNGFALKTGFFVVNTGNERHRRLVM